jgi:hypothetical protein
MCCNVRLSCVNAANFLGVLQSTPKSKCWVYNIQPVLLVIICLACFSSRRTLIARIVSSFLLRSALIRVAIARVPGSCLVFGYMRRIIGKEALPAMSKPWGESRPIMAPRSDFLDILCSTFYQSPLYSFVICEYNRSPTSYQERP